MYFFSSLEQVKSPTREVAQWVTEGIDHPHADQESFQSVLFLHFEPWYLHQDFDEVHPSRLSPLHKLVIGQLLLQLVVDLNDLLSPFWMCHCVFF